MRTFARWPLLALFLLAFTAKSSGEAQDTSQVKKVSGVVTLLRGKEQVPIPNAVVVLHRIGDDSTGVLDSVRTNASGRFTIDIRPFGAPEARYLLTSSHHGIAYIAVLGSAAELDSATADIAAFDTTLAAVPVTTLERIVVVFGPTMGTGSARRVLEIHQIANDSSVTRISPDAATPTWSTTVPEEAREFILGERNLNEHSLRLDNNVLKMFAPFAPGVVDIEFSYLLPESAFPVTAPIAANTQRVQVMLEEQGASATAPGLEDEGLVTFMGRNYYHRYHSGSVSDAATITITVPVSGGLSTANYLTIVVLVIGAGMLISLAITFRRRVAAASGNVKLKPVVSAATSDADIIARRIAELDDAHASQQASDPAAYKAERERLKRELKVALARQRGSS